MARTSTIVPIDGSRWCVLCACVCLCVCACVCACVRLKALCVYVCMCVCLCVYARVDCLFTFFQDTNAAETFFSWLLSSSSSTKVASHRHTHAHAHTHAHTHAQARMPFAYIVHTLKQHTYTTHMHQQTHFCFRRNLCSLNAALFVRGLFNQTSL